MLNLIDFDKINLCGHSKKNKTTFGQWTEIHKMLVDFEEESYPINHVVLWYNLLYFLYLTFWSCSSST
jgi:hypothetical protein